MSYGDVETVRELLGIDKGDSEEKIVRFLDLATKWIGYQAPSDALSLASSDALNTAANYYAVYLFRLSSERYSGDDSMFVMRWKSDAEEIVKAAINSGSSTEMYAVRKVNDEEGDV